MTVASPREMVYGYGSAVAGANRQSMKLNPSASSTRAFDASPVSYLGNCHRALGAD